MSSTRFKGERGAAVVMALLLAILVGAIAAALVTLTTTETRISATFREAQQASYAAEAALERALHDLATIPDWSSAVADPPANLMSTFDDGQLMPGAPDGGRIDLAQLTVERQAESDARDGPGVFGGDSPRWRLFAHAPAAALGPGISLPAYLVVWVADDESDGDGNPATDANGQILVRAVAFGAGGARRTVEARLGRSEAGDLSMLTRRDVR